MAVSYNKLFKLLIDKKMKKKECLIKKKEYVQRRSLTQLIYKGLDDVETISQEQYEQV